MIAHPALMAKPTTVNLDHPWYRDRHNYAELHRGYCNFWIRRGKVPMAVSRDYVEDMEAFRKWAAICRQKDLQYDSRVAVLEEQAHD